MNGSLDESDGSIDAPFLYVFRSYVNLVGMEFGSITEVWFWCAWNVTTHRTYALSHVRTDGCTMTVCAASHNRQVGTPQSLVVRQDGFSPQGQTLIPISK